METASWYATLTKPFWAPPSWIFGPVWMVLYILIAVSFVYVFWLFWRKKIPFIVLPPFLLNLVFNLAFSPIQFGLQNNVLAAIDILLVWGTLLWLMIAIRPYSKYVTYANIPYFLWVSFAMALQWTITFINWGI